VHLKKLSQNIASLLPRGVSNKSDHIFAAQQKCVKPFEFNKDVAEVFDDMVSRSIPFYEEIHRLCADLVLRYYKGEGKIIDLGCSTGTTLLLLDKVLKQNYPHAEFIGVDTSAPMLTIAQQKCTQLKNVAFHCEDMCAVDYTGAQVVILNYTLQFLKPKQRLSLLQKIYQGLRPGGIVILAEKIYSDHAPMQSLITDLYYDFKRRNGYSELEISQKREALENVLIPLTPKAQVTMLEDAGFHGPEMLFRWYNFASFLGQKEYA
jgi:tRNA (cmo5U34)-methyltransferase